ncbi:MULTISPECIES: DKNYY domain-containing protein [Actinosynnema]|uniref:Uncharacterized protein n=1 Tax=Actinosynnema pretiosum TaxID=42197 RepID=A0A290Z2T6_9PSEU|nr:DKNYY domain-containing protein [Actinosynnema pretiosum]ATE53285.1 hypothetical protein CNX65_08270 [Actinosynnema pretiosum]
MSSPWRVEGERVWRMGNRLPRADAATFRVLSFSFARDAERVWTPWHRVKADAATFRALDRGVVHDDLGEPVAHGYGADRDVVVFSAGVGRPVRVAGAEPAAFLSLGGFFGHDARSCYSHGRPLRGADPGDWRIVDQRMLYSTSGGRVYHAWRPVPADAATFTTLTVTSAGRLRQVARDAERFYLDGEPLSERELAERLR